MKDIPDFESLSFDEKVKLFEKDPITFDKVAGKWLEDKISSYGTPQQQWKAKKAQLELNRTLSKYKNPTARYNKFVELFYKKLSEFNEALNAFNKVD